MVLCLCLLEIGRAMQEHTETSWMVRRVRTNSLKFVEMVVRCFFGDDYVVDVAFPEGLA